MEKQIEEMAKIIHKAEVNCPFSVPVRLAESLKKHGMERTNAAIELYNADYRRQSEVVNKLLCEIKEEITAALDSNYRVRGELELSDELYYAVNGKISALRGIEGFITELENKYNKN